MLTRTRKQIQDFDFIFVFQGKKDQQLYVWKTQCQSLLLADKIQIKTIYSQKLKQTCLLVQFHDYNVVYRQAQVLGILKQRTKQSFQLNTTTIQQLRAKKQGDKNYIKYLDFIESREYFPEISEQQKLSPFKLAKKERFEEKKLKFNCDEELRCKYNELLYWNLEKVHFVGDLMIPYLQYPFQELMDIKGFVELVPVQKPSEYAVPFITDISWWYYGSVEKYVGVDVEVYFDLIRFMQRWLWIPILAGVLTIACNRSMAYSVDNSPADSIYSFVILFWSITFVSKWEMFEKWLKFKNSTGFNESWAFFQKKIIQDDGVLETRISVVTGEKEAFIPFWTKVRLHLVSWAKIIPLIILTLAFMILSLNVRGFVDSSHKLLYWKFFSQLSEPGHIFDKKSRLAGFVMFLHVVIINYVDENIYRKLVVASTKKEKHLQTKKYQNSIIIKFLIYEAIITFTDLFYIAFIRFDIQGLKDQMATLFYMDIIRRVVVETLIPYIKRKLQSTAYKRQLSKGEIDREQALKKQTEIQVSRPKYESFDDYLEIITNFGYLVMLSSAFPSAPIWILLSHFLEIIHDKYKILFLCKRALPKKFNGIGSWKDVLYSICYFSIITNIVLFAFSSQQIASFFPKLFQDTKGVLFGEIDILSYVNTAINDVSGILTSDPTPIVESCSNSPFGPPLLTTRILPTQEKQSSFLLVIFIIQHFILFVFLGIKKWISNQKNLAEIFKERRAYKKSIKAKIDFAKNRQSTVAK